jgi:lipoprotein-releasing system ATP-binding protein
MNQDMKRSTIISATGVHKSYGTLPVLKGIDMEVAEQEVVAIVGASGAGKSTLLHILGTLDSPDQGEVMIGGKNVFALSASSLASFRNQSVGFVFQFHNLLPEFSAIENVMIPALIARQDEAVARKRSLELLALLSMDHRKDHKPSEMSGGEQQRIAVARALVNSPSLVLADEPSGNLDSKNAAELHNLFFSLREQLKQTFIIVTHNMEFARMADRIIEVKDGVIVKA